jgi:hypothetical protein
MAVMQPNPSSASSAGISVYAKYVADLLAREGARQESLERRALAVITSAGAISALLFGLAAFGVKSDTVTLTSSAKIALAVALGLFAGSALCAIAVGAPAPKTEEAEPKQLKEMLKKRWGDSEFEAERMTTLTRLKVLGADREMNNTKAGFLFLAVILQALALIGVAVSILIILI